MRTGLLLTLAPWFLLLAALGFARFWKWALALNLAPAGLALAFLILGQHLSRSEDTDQSAVGALLAVPILLLAALASAIATFIGWAIGAAFRARFAAANASEGF